MPTGTGSNSTTGVTILGTGTMGSAIATQLLRRGISVTVWNRNPARAAALAQHGAVIAATVKEAVQASPVVLTCFLNLGVSISVLDSPDVAEALDGTIVLTTETATPSEVREFGSIISARSALPVDGKLMFYPAQIGSPEAILYLAGDDGPVASVLPVVREVVGSPLHVGTDISSAAVLYNAVWTYYYAGLFGFLEALAFVQRSGASVDVFLAQTIPATGDLSAHLADATRRFISGNLGGEEATVGVYVDGFATMRQAFLETGIDSQTLRALHELSQLAARSGHENHDIAAVATILGS